MGCYVLLQGLWLQGSRYGLCSVAGVVVVRVKVWAVFCCRGCGCRGEGMGCVLLQGLWLQGFRYGLLCSVAGVVVAGVQVWAVFCCTG
jgi:hypothetical protein